MGCQLNWIQEVYNWLINSRSSVYPSRCVLCGQPGNDGRDLCSGCLSDLPSNLHPCRRCATSLTDGATVCGPCQRTPPPFEQSVIPFRYAPPLDYLLQQLKFHQQLHLAPLLAGLLAETIAARGIPLPDLILPVPLHRTRLRERGYNQALELAKPLSRELSLPLSITGIRRPRATPAQTSLQGKERRKNLRDAFAVTGKLPAHVAILDDVVTTGATVTELTRTLKKSGVERVEIWAVAKAGNP